MEPDTMLEEGQNMAQQGQEMTPDEAAASLAMATRMSEEVFGLAGGQQPSAEAPAEEQTRATPEAATEEKPEEDTEKATEEGAGEPEEKSDEKFTELEKQLGEVKTSLEEMHKSHEKEMKKITQGIKDLLNESE